MLCQQCETPLDLLGRLTGETAFCSKRCRQDFQSQYVSRAIDRLRRWAKSGEPECIRTEAAAAPPAIQVPDLLDLFEQELTRALRRSWSWNGSSVPAVYALAPAELLMSGHPAGAGRFELCSPGLPEWLGLPERPRWEEPAPDRTQGGQRN